MAKRFKASTFFVGALLVIPMLLAACGPTSSTTSGGTTPVAGGSIVDAVQEEANSIMPQKSTETFSDLVDAAIWTPLVYTCLQNQNVVLCPGLATEVPTTANGDIKVTGSGSSATETVTIHLRQNLKWSDGSALTSADVAFAAKTFSDPTYAPQDGWSSCDVSSVSTPDTQTAVFNLSQLYAPFVSSCITDPLGFVPLPQAHYSSMTAANIAKDYSPNVTDGPFTVSSHVSGSHLTVVKNTNYYQPGKPYLQQITFQVFQDAATIVSSFQAGQVDTGYFMPVTSAQTLQNIPGYGLWHLNGSPNYEAWYFNLSNPILADINVREALAYGFNPQDEIKNIESGFAVPTCDDSTGTFAHEPSLVQTGGLCQYGPNQTAQFNPTAAGQICRTTAGRWRQEPPTGRRTARRSSCASRRRPDASTASTPSSSRRPPGRPLASSSTS